MKQIELILDQDFDLLNIHSETPAVRPRRYQKPHCDCGRAHAASGRKRQHKTVSYGRVGFFTPTEADKDGLCCHCGYYARMM